jgi:hypothetical protein
MAPHKITVDQLYREGRIHHPTTRAPDESAPQSEVRAPNYSNDTPNNWLRGMPSAERKPAFDHSQPKMRR